MRGLARYNYLMRAIIQRVSAATVRVDGKEVGRCGYGLMLLVGVHKRDTEREAERLAQKISTLRIFNDAEGKMNRAILDFLAPDSPEPLLDYGILAVSNFTVYGSAANSRRPSFSESGPYARSEELFHLFVAELRRIGIETQTGVFGANMEVNLINDGPVTLIVDVEAEV